MSPLQLPILNLPPAAAYFTNYQLFDWRKLNLLSQICTRVPRRRRVDSFPRSCLPRRRRVDSIPRAHGENVNRGEVSIVPWVDTNRVVSSLRGAHVLAAASFSGDRYQIIYTTRSFTSTSTSIYAHTYTRAHRLSVVTPTLPSANRFHEEHELGPE